MSVEVKRTFADKSMMYNNAPTDHHYRGTIAHVGTMVTCCSRNDTTHAYIDCPGDQI
jgi:hypothetical protein